MKIGIYSDLHISRNNGIMPLYLGQNKNGYTTRLDICKNTMGYMHQIFEQENVDVIINCGDTFNSHTVTSDELKCFSEIYGNRLYDNNYSRAKEYILIGNHDKFNDSFSSLDLLNFFNTFDIQLIDEFEWYSTENVDIYMIGYFKSEEFYQKVQEMLEKYPRQHEKAILCMHGDINGSTLFGTKKITNQIDNVDLFKNFDIVINGHIHCSEIIKSKDNEKMIFNIGSIMSHSFADSNNHIGSFYVYDTETDEWKKFINPYQILFRYYIIESEEDLLNVRDKLSILQNDNLQVILKIKCKSKFKDIVEDFLSKHCTNVISCKYILIYDIESSSNEESPSIKTNNMSTNINISGNIKNEFISFLKTSGELKYDLQDYEMIVL